MCVGDTWMNEWHTNYSSSLVSAALSYTLVARHWESLLQWREKGRGRERERGGGGEGKMAAGEAVAFLPTRTVISSGHACCKGGESSMSFGSSGLFGSGSYSSGKVSCSGHNINGKCGRRPRRSAVVRAELMQASRPMRSFENRTRFLSLSLSLWSSIRACLAHGYEGR
jgi:hypothetical protein